MHWRNPASDPMCLYVQIEHVHAPPLELDTVGVDDHRRRVSGDSKLPMADHREERGDRGGVVVPRGAAADNVPGDPGIELARDRPVGSYVSGDGLRCFRDGPTDPSDDDELDRGLPSSTPIVVDRRCPTESDAVPDDDADADGGGAGLGGGRDRRGCGDVAICSLRGGGCGVACASSASWLTMTGNSSVPDTSSSSESPPRSSAHSASSKVT
mmetsp:Transcript_18308/g.54255  ORF Transcript_18308/g.54255 Transcript_18308/m.54255 type:complete len:212 (-) Transcript_18308:160-795(-)